jgi:hypothetical protein
MSTTPRILNCVASPNQERDWGPAAAIRAGAVAAGPIPKSRDLRNADWKVGDQGATGSCVGWATADGVLRWHFTDAHKIKPGERLSVRYLWMASKETDEFTDRPTTFIEPDGTSLKSALDVARTYGIVPWDVLPFDGGALYPDEVETFYTVAARMRIATYHNLGRDPAKWRQWIATQGPILTRLDCDDTWMNAKKTKGVLEKYDPKSASGGHAVTFVGYTPDSFIVRNSWGTTEWGDKGFAYASEQYAKAAFTEAYGVTL